MLAGPQWDGWRPQFTGEDWTHRKPIKGRQQLSLRLLHWSTPPLMRNQHRNHMWRAMSCRAQRQRFNIYGEQRVAFRTLKLAEDSDEWNVFSTRSSTADLRTREQLHALACIFFFGGISSSINSNIRVTKPLLSSMMIEKVTRKGRHIINILAPGASRSYSTFS